MYGLPSDFDCNRFVERVLGMVCLTANQICLHFDTNLTITVEGSYAVQAGTHVRASAPQFIPALADLVEKRVVAARAEAGTTLVLTFDEGSEISCYDDAHYESYKIQDGDTVIIV
jgi:hypothetical protein